MTSYNEQKQYRVLVLCTGNSARSIMVEVLFNTIAQHYFQAYSAGSHPTGKVNPFAIEQIKELVPVSELASKSWNEFSGVPFDFVITVCGNAAQEICPCFAGDPIHVHWGETDPAAVTGSDDDIRQAFSACFNLFELRIKHLVDWLDKQKEGINNHELEQAMLTLANT